MARAQPEAEFYNPLRLQLEEMFKQWQIGPVHLEVTSTGRFSETLKAAVEDITFAFLKKQASPDIAGFIAKDSWKHMIVVEVKNERLSLSDIYQTKMYMDLFKAKYGLLLTSEPIPEELKRLHSRNHAVLNTTSSGYTHVNIATFERHPTVLQENSWFPEQPKPPT